MRACACVWLGWEAKRRAWGGSRESTVTWPGHVTRRPHGPREPAILARLDECVAFELRSKAAQLLLLVPARLLPATVGHLCRREVQPPPSPCCQRKERTSPDGPDGLCTPGTQGSRPTRAECWEASHQPSAGKADTFRRVLSMRLAPERTPVGQGTMGF